MSTEVLTGSFRVPQPQGPQGVYGTVNLSDFVNTATAPSVSSGAFLVERIPLAPTLNQTWTLIAWAVQLQLALDVNGTVPEPSYGRPGKLSAALMRTGDPTQGVTIGLPTQRVPWQQPYAPPNDYTNILNIWDGASDAPPSSAGGQFAGGTPFQFAENLASPIKLVTGGSGALIGLFLSPSMGNGYDLQVSNGLYSITYETE